MASNVLSLPFRNTVPVSLSTAIRQYISTKYDQHPDMFTNDLSTIDKIRNEAIWVREPHPSGIKKIQTYAAQLVWIGGKFPIDIGVDFTWYPAIGYHTNEPISQNNLRFELSNVLYNLCSLYSQLAVSTNRSTGEGLVSATRYFCSAAGLLSYLRTDIIPNLRSTPAEDMDLLTLESLEQLFLAQAQECSWQKARMDKFKDGSISKLAARVSDFYINASDIGTKSDAVSSEWLHHMNAKHHHFAAVAQYRAACDCLEKRKYGEEVARLRDSLICVNEGIKQSKWINKTVLEDLQGLKNKIQDDLKRAERDNDMIYLIPVPPKSELKTIDRVTVVAPKIPQEVSNSSSFIGDGKEFGPPLFAKLVPFVVHMAASIYTTRRDQLINRQVIEELDHLSSQIHDILQSYNLPGSLQAIERPLGIPPSHLSHAEEIRQQDGYNRLYKSIVDVAKLRTSDITVYREGVEILRTEKSEDDKLRVKHGTERWTRPASEVAGTRVYKLSHDIDGYLNTAANSDELIKNKLKEWSYLLKLLAGPESSLEAFVPSSRRSAMSPQAEREASKLRSILNEINRVDSRRRHAIQSIRDKVKTDDINTSINAEAARLERSNPAQKMEAADFESFFAQRMQRYDGDLDLVKEEIINQDSLVKRLNETQKAFTAARQGSKTTATQDREAALQKLDTAYSKYNDIASNLDGARTFYNDLAKTVESFRNDCKKFAHLRKEEAYSIENELSLPLSALSISNPPLQPQRRESYTTRAPADPPLAAPIPTRASPATQSPLNSTWSPNMGIKFGNSIDAGVSSPGAQPADKSWNPKSGFKFS